MRKYILIGLFSLAGFSATAQFVLKAKVIRDTVLLRWSPESMADLRSMVKQVALIKRLEWNGDVMPDETEWKQATEISKIIIPAKENQKWDTLQKKYSQTAFLKEFLFPDVPMSKEIEQNLFGLCLFSLDVSPELANETGFGFKDVTIETDKKYVYRIEINSSGKKSNVLMVDPTKVKELIAVSQWELSPKGKSIQVTWNFAQHRNDFSYYVIERSADSLHFVSVVDQPLVPLLSQYDKDKKEEIFLDTAVKENQWYWYWIYGVDHFGKKGKMPEARKIKTSSFFKGEIQIDTLIELKDGKASVKWKMTNQVDRKNSKSVSVFVAAKINGDYHLATIITSDQTECEVTVASGSNYIKVVAENSTVSNYLFLFKSLGFTGLFCFSKLNFGG